MTRPPVSEQAVYARANVYCSAYVGPFMAFTEMAECHTEFVYEADDPEYRPEWVPCPKCGADCLVEWPS